MEHTKRFTRPSKLSRFIVAFEIISHYTWLTFIKLESHTTFEIMSFEFPVPELLNFLVPGTYQVKKTPLTSVGKGKVDLEGWSLVVQRFKARILSALKLEHSALMGFKGSITALDKIGVYVS